MRILITGSSGKLGSALVRAFAHEHEIVQLDVVPPLNEDQYRCGTVHVGSVTDRELVETVTEDVEIIIHCGAVPSNKAPFDALLTTNVSGTVNLLEAAGRRASVRQFIFLSTIRVHGVLETPDAEFLPKFLPFDETHPYVTVEYYGGSKLHAEHWCRMYVKRFRKPVVVFRPSTILSIPEGKPFPARPAPERPDLNQYVATSDVIQAVRLALDHEPEGGFDAFLLHANDQRSITPSLELVRRWFPGIPYDREKLERCHGFGAFVDCSRAAVRLNWHPAVQCQRDL